MIAIKKSRTRYAYQTLKKAALQTAGCQALQVRGSHST